MRAKCCLFFGLSLYLLLIGQGKSCAQTWVRTSAPARSWRSIAMPADASKAVAAGMDMMGGGISYSSDGGVTWTQSGVPNDYWGSVTTTADGGTWMATLEGGNRAAD